MTDMLGKLLGRPGLENHLPGGGAAYIAVGHLDAWIYIAEAGKDYDGNTPGSGAVVIWRIIWMPGRLPLI
jgi:hypothetical protein